MDTARSNTVTEEGLEGRPEVSSIGTPHPVLRNSQDAAPGPPPVLFGHVEFGVRRGSDWFGLGRSLKLATWTMVTTVLLVYPIVGIVVIVVDVGSGSDRVSSTGIYLIAIPVAFTIGLAIAIRAARK